jgi:hypothetical protein
MFFRECGASVVSLWFKSFLLQVGLSELGIDDSTVKRLFSPRRGEVHEDFQEEVQEIKESFEISFVFLREH